MTVLFFISGHGFGHASRQVEIINALARRAGPDLRVVIRSAVQPDLLARTLQAPYRLRPGAVDAGIVQSSSVAHDDEATVRAVVRFQEDYEARVAAEAAAAAGVRLVVGDIPPLAFDVAARLGVPSVAIANFTWDWIYETHPGLAAAAPDLLDRIRAAYGRASLALELPFGAGFDVFPEVRRIPLVCRRPTRSRADTRRRVGIPADRPTALLSFGGYGLPSLNLSALDCLADWTIVTTDRSARPPSAVPAGSSMVFIPESAFVPSGVRYEDLVAAVDVVVTKPGYGIIAECIAAGTALLYTSRGAFREYDLLVRPLPRFVRSRFIPQADLFAGRWQEALSAIVRQPPPPETMAIDGADVAAAALADMCPGTRRT
jgi:L-arabinokinase